MANDFYMVLDGYGLPVDEARDAAEAFDKAQHYGNGEVYVDGNVVADAVQENPDSPMVGKAHKRSKVPKVSVDDYLSISLDEAKAELGEFFAAGVRTMLKAAEEEVGVFLGAQMATEDNARKWAHGPSLLRTNAKMSKVLTSSSIEGAVYSSKGLSLLPHGAPFRGSWDFSKDQSRKGSWCVGSTPECRSACLVNTGKRQSVISAYAASWCFSKALLDPTARNFFLRILHEDCVRSLKKGRTTKGDDHYRFVRLNVFSDIPWEVSLGDEFFDSVIDAAGGDRAGPETGGMFYDYTKVLGRDPNPDTYHLTWSWTGTGANKKFSRKIISGEWEGTVAVPFVFRQQDARAVTGRDWRTRMSYYGTKPTQAFKAVMKRLGKDVAKEEWLPWTFGGQPVFNGDRSDIRPLDDPRARVIGLMYKTPLQNSSVDMGDAYSRMRLVAHPEEMPNFLVRVRQEDPDSPPVVVGVTQGKTRRVHNMDDFEEFIENATIEEAPEMPPLASEELIAKRGAANLKRRLPVVGT